MKIGKQPVVGLKSIGCSQYISSSAEFDQYVTWIYDAGNISRSHMIGTAGDDRRAFGKSGGRRCFPGGCADDFMRRFWGGQNCGIDMAEGDGIREIPAQPLTRIKE